MWRLFDKQIFHSATKQTWPNKWDNMVSGGLSVGHGVKETAIKEAAEEASIPKVSLWAMEIPIHISHEFYSSFS